VAAFAGIGDSGRKRRAKKKKDTLKKGREKEVGRPVSRGIRRRARDPNAPKGGHIGVNQLDKIVLRTA